MLPDGDVRVASVVADRLAVVGLVLLAQMAAARLVALQRVAAHQLGELEEVGDPSGVLERLVDPVGAVDYPQVVPELLADPGNLVQGELEARGVAGDPA